jgi:hypothetical protein
MPGKNSSVSGKLLIILILPMLGIIWFGAMRVSDGLAHASAAKQIVKDTDFVGVLGSLIHELQKERGATSVFIGSRGAKMKDRLPGLRADSDKAAQAFKSRTTARFTDGNKGMQGALSGLDRLDVFARKRMVSRLAQRMLVANTRPLSSRCSNWLAVSDREARIQNPCGTRTATSAT